MNLAPEKFPLAVQFHPEDEGQAAGAGGSSPCRCRNSPNCRQSAGLYKLPRPGAHGGHGKGSGGARSMASWANFTELPRSSPRKRIRLIGYVLGAAALGADVHGNQDYLVFFGQGFDFRQGRPGLIDGPGAGAEGQGD